MEFFKLGSWNQHQCKFLRILVLTNKFKHGLNLKLHNKSLNVEFFWWFGKVATCLREEVLGWSVQVVCWLYLWEDESMSVGSNERRGHQDTRLPTLSHNNFILWTQTGAALDCRNVIFQDFHFRSSSQFFNLYFNHASNLLWIYGV